MVKLGKQAVNLSFALHLPIKGIIRATLYRHFVGGESINDCLKTIDRLAQRNVGAILDFAVEGEEKDELFDGGCCPACPSSPRCR